MERSDDRRHTEARKQPGLWVSLSLPARGIFPLKVELSWQVFLRNDPAEGVRNGQFHRAEATWTSLAQVLVNLDQILMVQPGQGTGGSAILFDREHLVTFEEDFATVIRRIQNGPYIEPGRASPPK